MKYEKYNPLAAFSYFLCGCGGIWGLITVFQLCDSINRARGNQNCQGWAQLVPIYGNLHYSQIITELNTLIDEHDVETSKVDDNVFLNLFLFFIPLYQILTAWEQVADTMNSAD